MRCSLIHIGMALAALLPITAAAQSSSLSQLCADINQRAQAGTFNPVSKQYTERVLDRADSALSRIQSLPSTPDFDRYSDGWAQSVQAMYAQLIDAEQTLELEERELHTASACLFTDLLLIDCKIDQARSELRSQMSRGSIDAITQLQDLIIFLHERRIHLAKGALDSDYVDPGWHTQYSFDGTDDQSTAWCCPNNAANGEELAQCTEGAVGECDGQIFYSEYGCQSAGCKAADDYDDFDDVMCPFHSDYAPAFITGYGCDLSTFEDIHNGTRFEYLPLYAEEYATFRMNLEADEFRESAAELIEIQQKIDSLFGNASPLPNPPQPDDHREAFGCSFNGGYCSNNEDRRCSADSDCQSDGNSSATCDVPDKVCSNNTIIRCTKKEHCENLYGTDDNARQQGGGQNQSQDVDCVDISDEPEPPLRALRSPFSMHKDEVRILSDFLGERMAEGIARAFTKDLRYPEEFSDEERTAELNEDSPEESWWSKAMSPIMRYFRQPSRNLVSDWNDRQGAQEGATFPAVVDPGLQTADSLSVLRKAVGGLARLASDEDGLRGFVSEYAYFMHRTCIYRACSGLLERVIRIALTDECFPYANGEFLGKERIWEECSNAAGVN